MSRKKIKPKDDKPPVASKIKKATLRRENPTEYYEPEVLLQDCRTLIRKSVSKDHISAWRLSRLIPVARKLNMETSIAHVIIEEIPFGDILNGRLAIMNLSSTLRQLKVDPTISKLLIEEASRSANSGEFVSEMTLSNIDLFFQYLQGDHPKKLKRPSNEIILDKLGSIEKKIMIFFKELRNPNERVKTPEITQKLGYKKGSIGRSLSLLTNELGLLNNTPRKGYTITQKGRALVL